MQFKPKTMNTMSGVGGKGKLRKPSMKKRMMASGKMASYLGPQR